MTDNLAKWLPEDDPRAVEINEVTRKLASMASHTGNLTTFGKRLAKGSRPALMEVLSELETNIQRHREHPFAYDGDLLLHHAFQAALILRHEKAGNEEWLRSYGVVWPEDDDEG